MDERRLRQRFDLGDYLVWPELVQEFIDTWLADVLGPYAPHVVSVEEVGDAARFTYIPPTQRGTMAMVFTDTGPTYDRRIMEVDEPFPWRDLEFLLSCCEST